MKFEDKLKRLAELQNLPPEEAFSKLKRRSLVSTIGCGAIIVIGMIVFFYGLDFFTSVIVEQTKKLSGDGHFFNPVSSYEEVREHAGADTELVSISARYVRSDGTMDLYADYSPKTEYKFFRETENPDKDTPPVGVGSATGGKWYEVIDVDVYRPGEGRYVNKMGGGVNMEYSYTNLGMDRDAGTPTTYKPGEPVEKPACDFGSLWQTALKNGAPADAVATIDYDSRGYDFNIGGTEHNYQFDFECNLIE